MKTHKLHHQRSASLNGMFILRSNGIAIVQCSHAVCAFAMRCRVTCMPARGKKKTSKQNVCIERVESRSSHLSLLTFRRRRRCGSTTYMPHCIRWMLNNVWRYKHFHSRCLVTRYLVIFDIPSNFMLYINVYIYSRDWVYFGSKISSKVLFQCAANSMASLEGNICMCWCIHNSYRRMSSGALSVQLRIEMCDKRDG